MASVAVNLTDLTETELESATKLWSLNRITLTPGRNADQWNKLLISLAFSPVVLEMPSVTWIASIDQRSIILETFIMTLSKAIYLHSHLHNNITKKTMNILSILIHDTRLNTPATAVIFNIQTYNLLKL